MSRCCGFGASGGGDNGAEDGDGHAAALGAVCSLRGIIAGFLPAAIIRWTHAAVDFTIS
jgi:hypothetical protein